MRKTIKKAVMTAPYSATYKTAFESFQSTVNTHFNVKITYGSREEQAFKRFHRFLTEVVECEIFLKYPSSLMVKHIIESLEKGDKHIFIETTDSKTDLVYYKLKPKTYDFIIIIPSTGQKKRVTKRYARMDTFALDYKKIAASLRAN